LLSARLGHHAFSASDRLASGNEAASKAA
jgi:hypothetical protein